MTQLRVAVASGGAGAEDVHPPNGNHGGLTYRHPLQVSEASEVAHSAMLDGAEVGAFEAQASSVGALPGAVLLDYLRARLPDTSETWAALGDWLGERSDRPFGWRAWYDRSALVLEGGIVAWCSDPERGEVEGILVDLPGRACACLGARLAPFLRWCCKVGNVTRCDWALDDYDKRLTLARILDAKRSGGVVTRWRQFTVVQNWGEADVEGWTVYLGSRRYGAMVRFYDKRAERLAKGADAGDLPEHWVRLELECKGQTADAIAREVLRVGNVAVQGQINRRLRFAVPTTDSNKRRWPVAQWWAEFMGSIEPGPSILSGEVPECTVSAVAAWVERQAGPALAMVLEAHGGDLAPLFGMLDRSKGRLKPKHRAALARYRAESVVSVEGEESNVVSVPTSVRA